VDAEMKMLRVIKKLKEESPLTVKSTFLGAHAIPMEYKNNREKYIDMILNEMIPQVKEEGLAEYIDVFCERGFFSMEESEKILQAGMDVGLKARVHANELDYSGGIQVGVKKNAISVDHLEFTGNDEIEALKSGNTIPTLLPGTAFFLKLDYPPARKIIDNGLPLALATDYNPGSCPSGNMNLVQSLACIHMNMTPEEAFNASTINSANAMEVRDEMGSISPGKKANLFTTKEMPSYAYLPYSFGSQ
ncbi:MAG: amidohydrolase family protein, partial [Flavobacteriales bacterium]